jgi:hypothetical protein
MHPLFSNRQLLLCCDSLLCSCFLLQLWRISDLLYLPEYQVVAELEAHRCEAVGVLWRCYAVAGWQHAADAMSWWLAVALHMLMLCVLLFECCMLFEGQKIKWWQSWRHTGAKRVATNVTWRCCAAVWWQHTGEARVISPLWCIHPFVPRVILLKCCCWVSV